MKDTFKTPLPEFPPKGEAKLVDLLTNLWNYCAELHVYLTERDVVEVPCDKHPVSCSTPHCGENWGGLSTSKERLLVELRKECYFANYDLGFVVDWDDIEAIIHRIIK